MGRSRRDPAPPPSWSVNPLPHPPRPEACGNWVRWGRSMEGKPLKASAKSSSHHGSGGSSLQDIRNMWTTATLSQPKLNVQLPTVREDSELEEVSVSAKTLWLDEKAGHDAEGGWEASDGGEDKDRFKPEEPEELELGGDSSQGSRLEEDDSKTDNEKPSSVSSLDISRHTPHRAYWVEQQSRVGGTKETGSIVGGGG